MKKLFKNFFWTNKATLLILILIVLPMLWWLWSLTLDGTDAKYTASKTKTALNRAVKGAVLALDEELLANEILQFDEDQARKNFSQLLQLNLNLNQDFTPRDNSPLLEAPEIVDFFVYQGPGFPQSYCSARGIKHIFNNPGILVVVKVKHKYNFAGREQEIYAYSVAEAER